MRYVDIVKFEVDKQATKIAISWAPHFFHVHHKKYEFLTFQNILL